jgi:mannose-6-phosphate isomerase
MDRLDNPVRRYAWGSDSDIPEFLGVSSDGGPQAEMWMGAHPGDSSRVVRDGATRTLEAVIAASPEAELGADVARAYGGRLPFLLKVLSAARPLSLQVHPDKARAEAAFAAENLAAENLAAESRSGANERDYLDDNHKPELISALRDGFQALCGFRPVAGTIALLEELAVPELAAYPGLLAGQPEDEALRKLVTAILTGPEDHSAAIAGVASAGRRVAAAGGPWAAAGAAYAVVADGYPGDPGVLVALLMNHAVLAEGEALFVAAGVPHCYLRGLGAEIMASSDNVLRAGLTSKRVNVPELLEVLDFQPAPVRVLTPVPDGAEEVYRVPVPDFRLARLRLGADGVRLPESRPQIVLCIAGRVTLRDGGGAELELGRGQSAYLPASETGVTAAGPGTALRATVGG